MATFDPTASRGVKPADARTEPVADEAATTQPFAPTSSPLGAAVFRRKVLQRRAQRAAQVESAAALHTQAESGVGGARGPLPHLDAIQQSFGRHDVTGVRAHTDGAAAQAASALGAEAYATGNEVAFGAAPSLHTAAHEAAHVVQQRAGVHLKGGVGEEGDAYERHADAVADAVVAGRDAEPLLDQMAGPHGGSGGGGAVQGKGGKKKGLFGRVHGHADSNLDDMFASSAGPAANAAPAATPPAGDSKKGHRGGALSSLRRGAGAVAGAIGGLGGAIAGGAADVASSLRTDQGPEPLHKMEARVAKEGRKEVDARLDPNDDRSGAEERRSRSPAEILESIRNPRTADEIEERDVKQDPFFDMMQRDYGERDEKSDPFHYNYAGHSKPELQALKQYGLQEDEILAITMYTDGYFVVMNAVMRGTASQSQIVKWMPWCQKLDRALAKLPAGIRNLQSRDSDRGVHDHFRLDDSKDQGARLDLSSTELRRGDKWGDHGEFLGVVHKHWKANTTVVENGFLSTSPKGGFGGHVTRLIDVGDFQHVAKSVIDLAAKKTENEVLFRPGTPFHIDEIKVRALAPDAPAPKDAKGAQDGGTAGAGEKAKKPGDTIKDPARELTEAGLRQYELDVKMKVAGEAPGIGPQDKKKGAPSGKDTRGGKDDEGHDAGAKEDGAQGAAQLLADAPNKAPKEKVGGAADDAGGKERHRKGALSSLRSGARAVGGAVGGLFGGKGHQAETTAPEPEEDFSHIAAAIDDALDFGDDHDDNPGMVSSALSKAFKGAAGPEKAKDAALAANDHAKLKSVIEAQVEVKLGESFARAKMTWENAAESINWASSGFTSAEAMIKERYQGLTENELTAIIFYTGGWSYAMNGMLRGLLRSDLWDCLRAQVKLVAVGLEKAKAGARNRQRQDLNMFFATPEQKADDVLAPLLDPARGKDERVDFDEVFRNLAFTGHFNPVFQKDYKKGRELHEKGFMSTTVTRGNYGEGAVTQNIKGVKGIAKSLNEVSFVQIENEALLPPGQSLRIDKIEAHQPGQPPRTVDDPMKEFPNDKPGSDDPKAFNQKDMKWEVDAMLVAGGGGGGGKAAASQAASPEKDSDPKEKRKEKVDPKARDKGKERERPNAIDVVTTTAEKNSGEL